MSRQAAFVAVAVLALATACAAPPHAVTAANVLYEEREPAGAPVPYEGRETLPASPVPYDPRETYETPAVGGRSVTSGLRGLVGVAVERLLLADEVAAAKFGTDSPITDPARERELLDDVAERSAAIGLDPRAGVRFFQAQIEAGKTVQRRLHARWLADPASLPRRRPDLATELRPRLDALTPRVLRLLHQAGPVRRWPAACRSHLAVARAAVEARTRLDALHRDALTVALTPVCEAPVA
ncbi:gamma subclass chorismate mutase AroQ [Nonomuraea aridisoli]|nr:gamma subclass chorismate mutase AroQ [Nonomuraea aridisoli]